MVVSRLEHLALSVVTWIPTPEATGWKEETDPGKSSSELHMSADACPPPPLNEEMQKYYLK